MGKDLSRRNFIKSGAIVAAGAAGAATFSTVAHAADDPENSFWIPDEWHDEADFVIIGFGGAGASAAVTAERNGASAIVLEKSPEHLFSGNSGVAVGGLVTVIPGMEKEAQIFMRHLVGKNVSEAEITEFVKESAELDQYLETLESDYELMVMETGRNPLLPTIEGNESVSRVMRFGNGKALYDSMLKTLALEDGGELITVYGETPATELIQNPITQEILGVYAKLPDGSKAAFKAKKAVIMCCGGFEADEDFIADFIYDGASRFKVWPWGSPYNTGDGIKLLSKVGGKLRHMVSIEWGSPSVTKASEELGCGVCLGSGEWPYENAILVNSTGKRFANELVYGPTTSTTIPTHTKQPIPHIDFDMTLNDHPNLPFYLITDETRISSGIALAGKVNEKNLVETWAAVKGICAWSSDNQKEIEKGYIVKAETLEELGTKMGIDGDNLAAQVAQWNEMVANGEDTQFGRTDQFTPVDNPPYYGVELGMSMINTQGGAMRDERHRALDWEDQPIPRLYACGEFGSIFGFLYFGGGNLPEAVTTGKAAIEFALEEHSDWD